MYSAHFKIVEVATSFILSVFPTLDVGMHVNEIPQAKKTVG
jgi:hypothetical protein